MYVLATSGTTSSPRSTTERLTSAHNLGFLVSTRLIPSLPVPQASSSPKRAALALPICQQAQGPQYGSGLNINRCNCPLAEHEDQFQLVNNWTKIIGNHQVKFGADLRYARNLRVPSDSNRAGILNFGTGPTSNGATGTGLGFASFVSGDATGLARYVSSSTNAKSFQKRDFFYVQDTWQATPNLTVNYGLRYEFYFPETVNGPGQGSLLNLATGYLNVGSVGKIPSNMGDGRNTGTGLRALDLPTRHIKVR